jgi:hypothetical protein
MWLNTITSKRSRNPSSALRPPQQRSRSSNVSPLRSSSPSSILAETLRKNAFRPQKAPPPPEEDAQTTSLNKDLHTLADVFPDIKVEVFRELLRRFDGDSRLQICTEQLYKFKGEWAGSRVENPPRESGRAIPAEDLFRSSSYINASTKALMLEFRSSSKSSVDAVLAEVNYSYSKARPILLDIANKSKWAMFKQAIGWKQKRSLGDAPAVLFERVVDGKPQQLIATESAQLDQELELIYVRPEQQRQHEATESADHVLATGINHEEAVEAAALFECQVCYNDVPFEDVTCCSTGDHDVCLDCVRRTLHEAIFGQGWHRSVDVDHGTLKCLSTAGCTGRIPTFLVQRAILMQPAGPNTWAMFESRLFEADIQSTAIELVRCPFCHYAEVDRQLDTAAARSLQWSLRKPAVPTFALILLLAFLPALAIFLGPLLVLFPSWSQRLFYDALAQAALQNRRSKFTCLNPACARPSCLTCSKAWHDPHICHEPLIVSLRTSVEAARTAAIKRVCPRCGTAFVKSSGCNKLTCVCGYSMCYLCRANIGKAGAAGNAEGAAGYRHFCEHFRPTAGKKCTECEKCDLYREEDEDEAVKQAGEKAEQDWRHREGMVGVKGLEGAVGNIGGADSWWHQFLRGQWTVQGVVNWLVGRCVIVEEV